MDIKEFFSKMNSDGIPLPMARDPKLKLGSITATLIIVSSGLCSICILLSAASAMTKVIGIFSTFSEAQQAFTNAFNLSFQFFIACGSFYLGRKLQRDPKGQLNIDGDGSDKKDGPG